MRKRCLCKEGNGSLFEIWLTFFFPRYSRTVQGYTLGTTKKNKLALTEDPLSTAAGRQEVSKRMLKLVKNKVGHCVRMRGVC